MTLNPTGRQRLRTGYEAVRAFAADGLTLFGSLLLFSLYLVPNVASPLVLVKIPNVLTISLALITGSMIFQGARVLRRTSLDLFFLVWMGLGIASYLYATTYLARQLPDTSLYTYLVFILSMWAAFRMGYALTKVSPRFGPVMLLSSMIFVLFLSAILGVFQVVGPFKVVAVDIGQRLAGGDKLILEGAALGRPIGAFGGPNLLGYANCLGALCLIGIGIAYVREAKAWHVLGIMIGLGVFGYSTLETQSRTSLAIYVGMVVAYGLALRRYGAPRASMATFVALVFAVAGLAVYAFQVSKYTYVESTLQNDIMKDSSMVVRQEALQMAQNIAVEIAPLGTSVGQANQVNMMYLPGYDHYWTIAVDNEWVNIYLTHGVWGPVLLGSFYLLAFRGVARARRSPSRTGRLIGTVATASLVMVLVFSISAVRIAKYETGLYTAVLLGSAFSVSDDVPRRRRRSIFGDRSASPAPVTPQAAPLETA